MADPIGPEDRTQVVEGSMQPPYLVIVDGPHKGSRYPLHPGKNTIGRVANSTVFLEDQSLSRQHAVLRQEGTQWIVEDSGSKNGTFVNGTQITEPVTIGHKDLLKFGIYFFRLILEKTPLQEELAPPPDAIHEAGTVMVEQPTEGETVNITPQEGSAEKEEAPPQEEEGGEELPAEAEKGRSPSGRSPLGRSPFRWWIIIALVAVVVLATGLYFYWRFVLTPSKPVAETPPPKPIEEQVQVIPLGPPEPPPPQKIPVFLDCVASPMPAMVRFQDADLGQTPLKVNIQLVPGETYEAQARFTMPELQEQYTSKVRFTVDATQSVVPLLFRAPLGVIKFLDLPRDASVYLEAYFEYDKFNGRPIKLQDVVMNKPIYAPFGRYVLEIRQPKAVGDQATFVESIIYRREFILAEDQPTFAGTINEESLGQFPVEISSIPTGAAVFMDGKKVGETPYAGMAALGERALTLQKEGYFEHRQQIKMEINTLFKAEIKLETSAAGEKLNAALGALNAGAYEEAVAQLALVFDQNPTEGEIAQTRYLLGKTYLKLNDPAKAESYFQQASQHENWKHKSLLGLVEVYATKNEVVKALPNLVDVLLNAKDDATKKEANDLFHKVSPFRSIVYVYTDPPGATVYVNDKKIEQPTPVILHEMALGNYRLRIEKVGYKVQELSLSLSVNEFNPVLVTLKSAGTP